MELTPEQAAADHAANEKILADPTNETKFPELFENARKIGYLKSPDAVDPILASIKDRFGDYSSTDEFLAEAEKWKSGAETNIDVFASLPEPLFKAIQAATTGNDWRKEVQGTSLIDFSKNYSEEDLVKAYSPIKFTDEELTDAENIAVKKAKQQARQAFEIDKQSVANEKLLAQNRSEQAKRVAKETMERSIENFKKINPAATESQIARLRKELSDFTNVQNKFLDGKGGYKVEAAQNLYPLIFGEDYVKTIVKNYAGKAIDDGNKAVEEIVNRGGAPRDFTRKPVQQDTKAEGRKLVEQSFSGDRNPFKSTPSKAQ